MILSKPEIIFEADDSISVCENTPLIKRRTDLLDVDTSYNGTDFYHQSTATLNSFSNSVFRDSFNHLSSQCLSLSTYLADMSRKIRSDTFSTIQHSVAVRSSLIMTLTDKMMQTRDSSLFLTICNIMPMLQGSTMFAMPFAVLTGGVLFIPVAIVLCIFADISGCLLVECLYTNQPNGKYRDHVYLEKKRVHMDIRDVAESCWGKFGGHLVHYLLIFYMISHNVVCVVIFGECIYVLFSSIIHITQMQMTLAFSVVFIPTLFVRRLSLLAVLGFIGVISIVVGSITSIVIFIQHASQWSHIARHIPVFNVTGVPLSLAILMYSILANVILPEIEGSMENPEQIRSALHFSYGISTVFKLIFGLFGALTFGFNTKQLVALNVAEYSWTAKYLITIFLLLYIITNFALLYFVLFEKLDKFMSNRFPANFHILWIIVSRILVVMVTTGIAIIIPFFGFVAGIVGSLTGLGVTFLFPVLFHLQLKWNDLSVYRKIGEILMALFGGVIGVLSLYSSLAALITEVSENGRVKSVVYN